MCPEIDSTSSPHRRALNARRHPSTGPAVVRGGRRLRAPARRPLRRPQPCLPDRERRGFRSLRPGSDPVGFRAPAGRGELARAGPRRRPDRPRQAGVHRGAGDARTGGHRAGTRLRAASSPTLPPGRLRGARPGGLVERPADGPKPTASGSNCSTGVTRPPGGPWNPCTRTGTMLNPSKSFTRRR